MTQISGADKQGLLFEIVSARIEDASDDKKHVIYTLQVRHISGSDDLSPSVIERRYTHFLNLYNGLKKEHPEFMANIPFPKKVLMGNFDNELISSRSTAFESLLKHVTSESKVRTSKSVMNFLQDVELAQAKKYLEEKDFEAAQPILESSFRLLNKVFTDRSPVVLLALCRLLSCCMSIPGMPGAQRWADLALHRYEGVSDSDLLELYVPLLHTCVKLWWQSGRNKDALEQRLLDLHRQGVKVNEQCNLRDAIDKVEKRLFST